MSQFETDIKYIREDISRIEKMLEKHVDIHVKKIEDVQSEIKAVVKRIDDFERWKIAFVAKFSVYSSLAIFVGTFAAQIAISFLTK